MFCGGSHLRFLLTNILMVIAILNFIQKQTFCRGQSKEYFHKVCCQMVQWFQRKILFEFFSFS